VAACLRKLQCLFGGILLIYVVAGCATAHDPLNSERISRKFGSYGIEVIENNNNIRVSNLYSTETAGRICRTFAVVGMTDLVDPAFAAEHDRIMHGASIGAVFRAAGWAVDKRHLYIGEIAVGRQATRLLRLMRIEAPVTLAVHVYLLGIWKNELAFDYAMIAEVHHPDYLTVAELREVFGSEFSADNNRNDARPVLGLIRRKFRDASGSG
jgi:hypothetical protein